MDLGMVKTKALTMTVTEVIGTTVLRTAMEEVEVGTGMEAAEGIMTGGTTITEEIVAGTATTMDGAPTGAMDETKTMVIDGTTTAATKGIKGVAAETGNDRRSAITATSMTISAGSVMLPVKVTSKDRATIRETSITGITIKVVDQNHEASTSSGSNEPAVATDISKELEEGIRMMCKYTSKQLELEEKKKVEKKTADERKKREDEERSAIEERNRLGILKKKAREEKEVGRESRLKHLLAKQKESLKEAFERMFEARLRKMVMIERAVKGKAKVVESDSEEEEEEL
ncbi:hypothetical protein CBR_g19619 [Chara braunii]|uniref:Uncharacterized protein n=1 Tax=Chara braunii TaxID=69332 RepID=A0A388KYG8_CHABU|nr:hypothetical protein CBR_g19619 [Chara braunii]|eukprot:GBG75106.1 hypothetical protein CBR_g19619 [Chara braunii]